MPQTFETRVTEWLAGIAPAGLTSIRIDGDPVPASRPRVCRNGHIYYPARYSSYHAECQRVIGTHLGPKFSGPLVVAIECVRARPKTTKLSAPLGDVDNLAKGPLDAATQAGLWSDDCQVVLLLSSKRFADKGETPHTMLYIGVLDGHAA